MTSILYFLALTLMLISFSWSLLNIISIIIPVSNTSGLFFSILGFSFSIILIVNIIRSIWKYYDALSYLSYMNEYIKKYGEYYKKTDITKKD